MKVNILVAKFFLCCKISADFVKWRGVGFVMCLYWDFQASSISGIKVGVTGLVTGVRCYRLIHFLQGTSAFQVLWKVESCCQLGTLREKEKKKKRNPNPYQHPSKIHSERRGGGKRGKKPYGTSQFVEKNILMVMVCIYFLKNLFLSLHFATEMLILVKTIIGSWNHCLPTCTARARLKLCNQNQWCWISHLSPS